MLDLYNFRLNDEYERSMKYFEYQTSGGSFVIGPNEILKAHFIIVDHFSQQGENINYGVKDFNLLASAISRQTVGFGNVNKWNRLEEIAATLFFGIIKNHSFHDANKRTALLTLIYHLILNGRTWECKLSLLDELAVKVADNKLHTLNDYKKFRKNDDSEILYIAYFIRKHTRPIDNKYYVITYKELDKLLQKRGYFLDNPSNNYIEVCKRVKQTNIFGFSKEKIVKILKIGFPGWKSQVNLKAIKSVLKEAHLTAEYGVDSQSFFQDADPLYSLIEEYQGPLNRLKDK